MLAVSASLTSIQVTRHDLRIVTAEHDGISVAEGMSVAEIPRPGDYRVKPISAFC